MASVVGDLDGLSAERRDLPDPILSGSVRTEVDPPAISRKAGHLIVGRVRSEATRLAARSGYHIDLELAFEIGVEYDGLSVGRPAGRACEWSAHRGKLDGVGAVEIG